jgi:hypothetical protein
MDKHEISYAGTLLTWEAHGVGEKDVATLREALKGAGLEKESALAKEFTPRNAFRRACRRLKEDKIIQQLNADEEGGTEIRFQINNKVRAEGGESFEYPYSCDVKLDTATGALSSDDPAMEERARDLFKKAVKTYSGADVTNLTRKVIDRLFGKDQMIRISRGVFFVSVKHGDAVQKVDKFLQVSGARPVFFDVPLTKQVKESITDAVDRHFDDVVKSYEAKIKEIEEKGEDVSGRLLKSAEEDLKSISSAIKSYTEFLGDRHAGLMECLKDCEVRLDTATAEKAKAKAEARAKAKAEA